MDLRATLTSLRGRLKAIEGELVGIADSIGAFAAFIRDRKSGKTKKLKLIAIPALARRRRFSQEEDARISDLYKQLGAIALAKRLKRSASSIRQRASDLGLTAPRRQKVNYLLDGTPEL